MIIRRPVLLVAGVLTATLATAGLGGPGSAAPTRPEARSAAAQPAAKVRVIVTAAETSGADPVRVAGQAVVWAGGRLTRALPLVDGVAAVIPADRLAALAAAPGVRSVSPDQRVRVAAQSARLIGQLANPPGDEPTSVYPQALRADEVWAAGYRGTGKTVALIDTGVSERPDLAGRLVTVAQGGGQSGPCKNFSGEPTCADTYGHGTFVAGIIAGDGSASGGSVTGIAPAAKVVSVKVAGADGSADVSTVLAAIQWVVSFRATYGINVLNLSLATDSTQTYRTDPFNLAVERAWDAGIAVIVAAGNLGPEAGTITKPADDPLVVTVGSVDDRGTASIADDELPEFTSRGPTASDGLAKPDVAAPGAHLLSLRSPGSTLELLHPGGTDPHYRRGSGTSFSAAAVSGVAALMLQRNPGMTPNQLKHALVASARPVPAADEANAVGAGLVDAAAAVLNPPAGSANAGVARSNGTGLLDASRGHVTVQTLNGTLVNGLLTGQLLLWSPTSLLLGWNTLTWNLSTYQLLPWSRTVWGTSGWPGHNWGGHNWGGGSWQGATWDGDPRPRDYGDPILGSLWYGAWG